MISREPVLPVLARRLLAPLLALALTLTACTELTDAIGSLEPTGWTGRFLVQDDLAWASRRDLTLAQFESDIAFYSERGFMIVDVDVRPEGAGVRYALVAHENPDGRDWAVHYDLTSSEYNTLWQAYRDDGYRPLDVEGYLLDGQLRFAGIWIENVEGLAWSSIRNMTSAEYADYFELRRAEGLRPIDIEAYETGSGLRFAAIWIENVAGLAWAQLRNLDRETYQQEVDARAAAGYLMIDFESYPTSGGQRYAAIWERPADRPAFEIRTDRTALDYANLWRTYRDQGFRIADFEHYEGGSGPLYGGIWIENAERFRYPRKGAIDAAIDSYMQANAVTGLSVAVIQGGTTIYRRGVGFADVDAGTVAHGETVYGTASVSKVIGATLAAKLEAEGVLRDGTTFTLDMSEPVSTYLDDLPSHHTQTVEQLSAHLGCVAHYDTTPAIANQTTHYDTALDAAESIWDVGVVTATTSGGPCTIGSTRSYSTPAFTLLAAVLEEATGRTVVQLLEQELFAPNGLSSMRVQMASGSDVPDYERTVRYSDAGAALGSIDNTWKVFGGGIEASAVDLARFGWRLLDGRIVDPAVRDGRLWTPVDATCANPGGGTCRNGVGWELRTVGGRRVAEHGGSWSGSRSHLRVYRDDDVVIAVLSNRRGHAPSALVTTIGDIVLGP